MSKVTSLFDILSSITTPETLGPDYYFYKIAYSDMKSWKDNILIVGEGSNNSGIYREENEKEYNHEIERHRYSLSSVYKFDMETYKLIDNLFNIKVSDFNMVKGIDSKYEKAIYFKNELKVNAFDKEIVMGNGLLKKSSDIRIYSMGNFESRIETAAYTNQMPAYPNGTDRDFTAYFPGDKQTVITQLKYLQEWIEGRDFVTKAEFEYAKRYKAYLDHLAKYWQIYENEDYKRKAEAMKLFQNGKSQ